MKRWLGVRGYMRGDERRFVARADFAAAYEAEGRRLPDGPKWTLTNGWRVFGVGGFEMIDGDLTLYAWAYMADLTAREWLLAIRAAEAVIKEHAAGRRVEAMPAHTPEARRLLQRIGFRDKKEAA